MKNAARSVYPLLIFLALLLLQSCCAPLYSLTIAHLNDSHSHLEATPVNLTINGLETRAQLGGFGRLQTLVDQMRADSPNFLLLHAGDAVQGTLYFTLFKGTVEFDFLNRLGVAAMAIGNHEFDRGPAAIAGFLDRARFPLLSSNIDFSSEAAIAGRVPGRLIYELSGERIGIFGLTTTTTPQTTPDVGNVRFLDCVAAARRQVAELEGEGVDKIIALTHLGYQEDLRLAAAVNGIDLIVGGHSHTLLGDRASLKGIGLVAEGPYPSEVRTPDGGRTLVLQAWQWGQLLGKLKVTFDSAGRVREYVPGAVIPVAESFTRNGVPVPPDSPEYREIVQALRLTGMVRIVAEDTATLAALAPYSAQLVGLRAKPVARAAEDLPRGINSGPGPLIADSMLQALPGAELALLNYGGVRKDLTAGMITVGDLLELMPFGNSLVLLELSGAELKQALEEGIAFLLAKYGRDHPALPYVAGISFGVLPAAASGSRVVSLAVRGRDGTYRPVDPAGIYRTVVNSFLAGGGDGFSVFKNSRRFRSDSGIIDSDALAEFLAGAGVLHNPREERVRLDML
jgi:5'-nucleotidase